MRNISESIPGVSEEKYNRFTTKERNLFDLATSQGSGRSMQEVKEITGMTYAEVKGTAESLIKKDVPIRINEGSSTIFSFSYSVYADDFEIRVQEKIQNMEEITMQEKTWEAVVQYIEDRMHKVRNLNGKLDDKNWELWRLKKAMQEVDPTITNVGETFAQHEDAEYDK